MKLRIQDAKSNPYLSKMFWEPLRAYMRDKGFDIEYSPPKEVLQDCVAIVHGDMMSEDKIHRLKQEACKVVIFDINDSSYLSSAYIHTDGQDLVDLIFKVSGVPKVNEINETNLDRNFNIKLSLEKYLPEEQWSQFVKIRPKIKPLPYVLWSPLVDQNASVVPQQDRTGKVLIRGGNHFWRVVLFFRMMQDGLLDEMSEFHTSAYFSPTMEQRFQFCDACKSERSVHGRTLYDSPQRPKDCTNPSTCWQISGEFFGGPMFGRHEHGYWNNRCPHSFFSLAKQFEVLRGPLNHEFLERAFSGDMRPQREFVHDLGMASYSGDCKWLNTINVPPRFWEAASLGTPSFYMARTADQDYWPHMNDGEHYFTYVDDMSNFDVSSHDWQAVSRASKALYEENIRGTHYPISNSLLEYMKINIEEACS